MKNITAFLLLSVFANTAIARAMKYRVQWQIENLLKYFMAPSVYIVRTCVPCWNYFCAAMALETNITNRRSVAQQLTNLCPLGFE